MVQNNLTAIQIQGINAEQLLQRFDNLENQIKALQAQPQPQSEKLITRDDTAKLLGVSIVTVHNWVKSGILTAYRVGNKVRFKESEVFNSLQAINQKKGA
ncbi:helix-turn-helix domain-containing protein [Sphingobacterium siyangense]|uniref:helix-turn-helix domain-containing protein n=1 Tax=Sphingobacterium siyangense TaxID=459529 RepID=UPI003DA2B455